MALNEIGRDRPTRSAGSGRQVTIPWKNCFSPVDLYGRAVKRYYGLLKALYPTQYGSLAYLFIDP